MAIGVKLTLTGAKEPARLSDRYTQLALRFLELSKELIKNKDRWFYSFDEKRIDALERDLNQFLFEYARR
jgi:hypothetical protein